jgi:hypothetical protein
MTHSSSVKCALNLGKHVRLCTAGRSQSTSYHLRSHHAGSSSYSDYFLLQNGNHSHKNEVHHRQGVLLTGKNARHFSTKTNERINEQGKGGDGAEAGGINLEEAGQDAEFYDIIIAGGGLVGTAMAVALGKFRTLVTN